LRELALPAPLASVVVTRALVSLGDALLPAAKTVLAQVESGMYKKTRRRSWNRRRQLRPFVWRKPPRDGGRPDRR